jgi:hypothetical protein
VVANRSPRSAKYERSISAADFEALPLTKRKLIIQGLLVEHGFSITGMTARGQAFDLLAERPSFGTAKKTLFRISETSHEGSALKDLQADAERDGCGDFVLVGTTSDDDQQVGTVHYLSAATLLRLVEDSALIKWAGAVPQLDEEAYKAVRERESSFALSDPSGIRWLRSLSLNKLPYDLQGSAVPAETWFEIAVFRVFTRILGFDGRRLGADAPGKREPDGIIFSPSGTTVLFDAKAARDGWSMGAPEERKLLEYVRARRTRHGAPVAGARVLIVSSYFTAAATAFNARRKKFVDAGSDLAYLAAADLADAAAAIAGSPLGVSAARRIDWDSIFDAGNVTAALLEESIATAIEAERTATAGDS